MIKLALWTAVLAFGLAAQPLLIRSGHPYAVWLWCDMAGFCAPPALSPERKDQSNG